MILIEKLNRLIDIWNHPDSKGMSFIDCPEHEYILGLESMTIEKITVTGYMLSAEDIMDIWVDELAKIDINELNELTKKYM